MEAIGGKGAHSEDTRMTAFALLSSNRSRTLLKSYDANGCSGYCSERISRYVFEKDEPKDCIRALWMYFRNDRSFVTDRVGGFIERAI